MSGTAMDSFLNRSALSGLQLLVDAHSYASGLSRNQWDFAVGIREMRGAGCTINDLRFLVLGGYAAKAVATGGPQGRQFLEQKPLALSRRSYFVLTELGFHFAAHLGLCGQPQPESGGPESTALGLKPRYLHRELRVGDKIVKQFRQPAESQETILLTFEELGWVEEIDDPLPQCAELDPKQRLRQTIANLNRNQRHRLIHFFGNGTGQQIRWEWRT